MTAIKTIKEGGVFRRPQNIFRPLKNFFFNTLLHLFLGQRTGHSWELEKEVM